MSENVSNQWSTPTLGLVSIWLCLALARQAFDLIGRLWLPVIFNLLQILCCIIGLFAVCQRRRALLGVFIVTSLLSTIYNILLLLWYEDVFPSSTHYTIPLSFGLPLSFSFFLKYTPGCSSHFDLQKSFYVQDDCLIRFTHLEAAQCVLHMLFAISTMITTILMLCERDVNKRKIKGKTHSLPTVSIESIPRSNGRPLSRVPPSILDTGSVRSGYVNSSYDSRDDVNGVRTSPNYRQDPIHAFPNANYEDPQDPQENRQPATQLQYSKRKSGGQNVENARSKPPNQIDQRQSGLFRKARDHRQNRHSRLPPEYPSLHSDPHSHSKSVPQPSPLHSLVSFDPKKGRNFLTVQERVPSDESDDETISDESPVSDDRRNDDIEPRKEIIPKRDLSLDAQYSKVQKRNQPKPQMRSTSQRDLPNEPSSYRDAIDHGNGKSSLRLRKDQGIDQEEDQEDDEIGIDDPAYERISVYRRLGEAKSIKNERMPVGI
ncbi:unnamed protein product, partial [Mesorhabditis belari]|uniref:Sodium/potassium-transporting ATPase subunit beta-1-interacting protein n=1 Tax=Mesorhabditis belari TaxID=2138241 RepID=A0AAF3EJF6_9BILA